MSRAYSNSELQKWGILTNYRTALLYEDYTTAEAIRNANPQVLHAEFTKIDEEILQTPSEE